MRPDGRQADHRVHKEAHLPLTFPFKNCFEGVYSRNVDIFLLQPIPSVDDPLREENAPYVIKVASGLLDLCCMILVLVNKLVAKNWSNGVTD